MLMLSALGCGGSEPAAPPPPAEKPAELAQPAVPSVAELRAKASALFGKLPAVVESKDRPLSDAKVLLGRTLYHDPRLSKNQDLSCASCHALDGFGADTRPEALEKGTSFGHKKAFGGRNAPTVLNAAIHIAQFWDGRAADVEAQAKGPVLNPVEMAMKDEASVVAVLKSIPGYQPMFKAAFPEAKDAVTYDNMATAIGAFERKLMTPSDFDKFLDGQDAALTADQQKGLDVFVSAGCIACHSGPGFGGAMYQKLGLLKPYPTQDEGRFAVTKNEADKFFFKVPSLRNVEKTGPYFHDGSVKTLKDAIGIMSEYQTPGGKLPPEKIDQVAAFLGSLTGSAAPTLLEKPTLPESGPTTPKPDPN